MAKTILKSKNAFDKICSKKFKYSELVLLATSNKYLSEQEKLEKKKASALMYKLKQRGLSVQNYEAVILMIEKEIGHKAVKHRNDKTSTIDVKSKAVDNIVKHGALTGRIPCNCENKCTMPRTVKSNTFGLLHKSTQRIKLVGTLDKTIGYLECLKDHNKAQGPFAKSLHQEYEMVEVFYKKVDNKLLEGA